MSIIEQEDGIIIAGGTMTNPSYSATPDLMIVLDIPAMEEVRAIMGDTFPAMVDHFFSDGATCLARIAQGFATGQAEAIVQTAHTLESSSRQMGATHLADIAMLLEHEARPLASKKKASSARLQSLAWQMGALKEALAITHAALTAMLPQRALCPVAIRIS